MVTEVAAHAVHLSALRRAVPSTVAGPVHDALHQSTMMAQATGVVAEQLGMDPGHALLVLRAHSRDHGVALVDLLDSIVHGRDELYRFPGGGAQWIMTGERPPGSDEPPQRHRTSFGSRPWRDPPVR